LRNQTLVSSCSFFYSRERESTSPSRVEFDSDHTRWATMRSTRLLGVRRMMLNRAIDRDGDVNLTL